MQNFQALGAAPPDPYASRGWGLCPQPPVSGGCPQTPKTAPHSKILATRMHEIASEYHETSSRSRSHKKCDFEDQDQIIKIM